MANTIDKPLEGWAVYKQARASYSSEDQQEEFYAEADVADTAILLPASTLEGVAAKLRRAFISLKGDAWAEQIALGYRAAIRMRL